MPRKPGTSGSEGGRRKRTRSPGTSSAAYPTSCPRSIGAAGRAEASANAEPAAYLTTVPAMPDQRHSSQLRVADLDPGRIATTVKLGADPQARSGPGRAGQVHDRLVAHQRPTPPIHRDLGEQPMLDPVPLRRAGWEVAHRDRKAGLGGKLAELHLPQPAAIAVGPARIGTDQQP